MHLDLVERNKILLPLSQMMKMLQDFKELEPTLSTIPKRVLQAEQNVEKLQLTIGSQLLSLEQYKTLSNFQQSDIKTIMDNIAQQAINKIETLIETRIPFKQLDEFVKQRNIFQSFKTAERRMQTFNQ